MDLTGDCYVDMNDIALMAGQWLDGPTCPADYDDCDANEQNACEANLLSNYHNCGACGDSCINLPGTYCEDGNCVPFVCDELWADCDVDPNNGCEFNLSGFVNTCASPYDIGTIRGDAGSDQIQYSNHGSMFLRVMVTETDPTPASLSVRFELDCPADVNYRALVFDMSTYSECIIGTNMVMAGGCGDWDLDCICWPETYSHDDTRRFVIAIEAVSGSTCGEWTLTVTGNQCPSPIACPLPICPDGRADCDGLDYNGCEVYIFDYPYDCSWPIFLGSVSGDTGSQQITYSDRGGENMRIYVSEDNGASAALSLGVALSVPTGVNYDLCIYEIDGENCELIHCLTESGDENGCICWPDIEGNNDSKDIIIKVYWDSGSSCDDWELTVTGNVACSNGC
jgi:hypothetical protein